MEPRANSTCRESLPRITLEQIQSYDIISWEVGLNLVVYTKGKRIGGSHTALGATLPFLLDLSKASQYCKYNEEGYSITAHKAFL